MIRLRIRQLEPSFYKTDDGMVLESGKVDTASIRIGSVTIAFDNRPISSQTLYDEYTEFTNCPVMMDNSGPVTSMAGTEFDILSALAADQGYTLTPIIRADK